MNEEQLINAVAQAMNSQYERQNQLFESYLKDREDAKQKGYSSAYIQNLDAMLTDLASAINAQRTAAEKVFKDIAGKTNPKDVDVKALTDAAKVRTEFMQIQRELDRLEKELQKERRKTVKNDAQIAWLEDQQNNLKKEQNDKIEAFRRVYGENTYAGQKMTTFIESGPRSASKQTISKALDVADAGNRQDREQLRAIKQQSDAMLAEAKTKLEVLNKGWQFLKGEIVKGYGMWSKYNAQAISDAKRLGMVNKDQAMGYMETLMEKSKDLSRNFGISAEQASKMQESFSKVTGKATILTTSQMEDIAASSRLMGEETVQSAIQVMDNIGTTSETTMGLIDKNYARALNTGLDVTKASEAFVKNLSLANTLNFRNGVDGISKMTIMSQRIKFNLEEVAKVADKFSTIEGAIEGSAKLQVLGGSFAMMGGNPLQMLYESIADPEALYERTANMFGKQAIFNRKTGESEIAPTQRQFIYAAAEAMGISKEEAIKTSKKQAELNAIEGDWKRTQPGAFAGATDEEKAILGNLAKYDTKTQSWQITYYDEENKEQTKKLADIDKKTLDVITKNNINVERPVEDIRKHVRDIASKMVSWDDRIKSMKDQVRTAEAQAMHPAMTLADQGATKLNNSSIWSSLTTPGGVVAGLAAGAVGHMAWTSVKNRYGNDIGNWFLRRLMKDKGVVSEGATGNGISTIKRGGSWTRIRTRAASQISELRANTMAKLAKVKNTAKAIKTLKLGSKAGAMVSAGLLEAGLAAYSFHNAGQERKAKGEWIEHLDTVKNPLTGRRRFNTEQEKIKADNEERLAKGEAIGAGTVAIISSTIGGVLGGPLAPLGIMIGGAIGSAVGGWIGKKLTPEKEGDTIAEHLKEIQKGDEEDNFRKIVLPIESIDYNVSLIANQLGILSAQPARGNVYLDAEAAGEIEVEGVALQASSVNQVDTRVISANETYRPTGPVTLHVDGAIELNMKGINISKITPEDFKKMVNNNPEIQRYLAEVVFERNNFTVQGQPKRAYGENLGITWSESPH